jgi:hypothetical protein
MPKAPDTSVSRPVQWVWAATEILVERKKGFSEGYMLTFNG